MDTGSHLVFGASLAGLAYLDPSVLHDVSMAHAVMIGTLLGSHAPDFDTVLRVKGFASYIRFHRGITHSVPALFLWPAVIAVPLAMGFGVLEHLLHLYLWTFLAVAFHVGLDTLNSYGVQSARPFSRKWVHMEVLAIFEPFLFLVHCAGLSLWLIHHDSPVIIFPWVYAITLGYIALRSWYHHVLILRVKEKLGLYGVIHVLPTFHWFHSRLVIEAEDCFYTGVIEYRSIHLEAEYPKEERNSIIQATMGVDGVRAFLGFAQRIHVTCKEVKDGYEVSWSDVRFFHGRKLPFGVDVMVSRDMNVVGQRLGWRKKAWEPPFV